MATIGILTNIRPHPLEHLRIAEICGKQVIVGNHYDEGTLGIFFPDGTIIPDKLAEEMWVKGKLGGKKRNRVVAKERNGILSEGLFYGSRFFTTDGVYHDSPSWNSNWVIGQNVAKEIGIDK